MIQLTLDQALEEQIIAEEAKIPQYLEGIEARKQGFYSVIDDEGLVEKIEQFAASVEGKFSRIVVLGIGGSSLGTICLQQSLTHLYASGKPELMVLDNIDPDLMKEAEDVIDYGKTLFLVVTKSGGTPETLAQYFYFRAQVEKKGLVVKEHFVFVTDPEKGLLRKIANEEGIPSFEVPPNVGGRFSVLTAVGLLPARLIGVDIQKLLLGAREMRDLFLSDLAEENLPFQMAQLQFSQYGQGKVMNVMMPYAQKLIRFADWYRQLLAESTGKRRAGSGRREEFSHSENFVGITPINALGATDQHSQCQLYNDGPNDKLFIFLKIKDHANNLEIPGEKLLSDDVAFLKNVSFQKLLHTELEATMMVLTENDRPWTLLEIDTLDEEHLGGLFMLFEGATAFLGEMFGIDAFDQPGVERAKILTKEFLLKEENID